MIERFHSKRDVPGWIPETKSFSLCFLSVTSAKWGDDTLKIGRFLKLFALHDPDQNHRCLRAISNILIHRLANAKDFL